MSTAKDTNVSHDMAYVLRICAVASLGGLLFGYDTAVISGAIDSIRSFFSLSPAETGWAVSNVVVGCVIGAMSSGWLSSHLGRKKTLIIAAILFAMSALGSALVDSFSWFIFYRWIGGLAVGVASTISPMYMSEVSPKDMRGRALGMQQAAIVIGAVTVFYVNYKIAQGAADQWLIDYGWRWMLGSEILPCVLFLAFVFSIPESPRWQVMHGNEEGALSTLTRISNREHARHLLREIRHSLHLERKASTDQSIDLKDKTFILIVCVACMIAAIQQVTGVNVMMYYAPMVLKDITGDMESALFMTIWIGVMQMVGSLIGMFITDRVGRIPLMRLGTLGVIASLLFTSWGMYSGANPWLILSGMLLFMLTYGISWGVGMWILISEIFPNHMRSFGMSAAVGSNWVANFMVSQFFPMINENSYLVENFHGAFPMWLFAGLCLFGYWFIGRYVPETSGVPLEKMEEVMLAKASGKSPCTEEAVVQLETR